MAARATLKGLFYPTPPPILLQPHENNRITLKTLHFTHRNKGLASPEIAPFSKNKGAGQEATEPNASE
jgi:hypothetical protein